MTLYDKHSIVAASISTPLLSDTPPEAHFRHIFWHLVRSVDA